MPIDTVVVSPLPPTPSAADAVEVAPPNADLPALEATVKAILPATATPEDVACPADRPIFECEFEPSQQFYTIPLNCAQKEVP